MSSSNSLASFAVYDPGSWALVTLTMYSPMVSVGSLFFSSHSKHVPARIDLLATSSHSSPLAHPAPGAQRMASPSTTIFPERSRRSSARSRNSAPISPGRALRRRSLFSYGWCRNTARSTILIVSGPGPACADAARPGPVAAPARLELAIGRILRVRPPGWTAAAVGAAARMRNAAGCLPARRGRRRAAGAGRERGLGPRPLPRAAGEQCEAAWPSQGRGMVSRGRAGRILICKWQACTGHGRLCRQP